MHTWHIKLLGIYSVSLRFIHSFNENFENNNVYHLTMNQTETFHNIKEIEITNSEKEGKKKTLQASALWQSEGGSNL